MVMLAAYRHDAHKFRGQPHADAPETFAGVPVNQDVPGGADGDASALSRPQDQREPTVDTHETHYRLSLLTGESHYEADSFTRQTVMQDVRDLLTIEDAERAHRAWLTSDVAATFNESVYHPYTSLKYHTLLVAALLDNYREGNDFADLHLVVDAAEEIVPHRTVYVGKHFTLRLDSDPTNRPSARLGSRPWRSWASTWNRLTAHPLDADTCEYDRVLDSNLRRIGAWSTALQYIEDYQEWRPDR